MLVSVDLFNAIADKGKTRTERLLCCFGQGVGDGVEWSL